MRPAGRNRMVIALGKNLGMPVESSEIRVVIPHEIAPTSALGSGAHLPAGPVRFQTTETGNSWLQRWMGSPVRRRKSLKR